MPRAVACHFPGDPYKINQGRPVMLKRNATQHATQWQRGPASFQGIVLCWHVLNQGTDTIPVCLEICLTQLQVKFLTEATILVGERRRFPWGSQVA